MGKSEEVTKLARDAGNGGSAAQIAGARFLPGSISMP